MREFIKLIDSVYLKEEAEIAATRRVQDTGSLTNFNIKQDDPFKLFTGLRNGGSNYSRDDIVKVHYTNDERLQAFLSNSDGRGAVEVDSDGNPVSAPQSNDELDADSADNGGATTAPVGANPAGEPDSAMFSNDAADADSADSGTNSNPSAGKIENGRITFSTGETFYREESGRGLRLFQRHVGGLIRRMDELVRKMNESVPNSLKAVLSESDRAQLFLESLSNDEAAELVRIVGDLELAIQAEDDQGKFISSTNINLIRDRISTYRPVVDQAREQMNGGNSADDADSADNGTADSDTPPEAQAASDDSNDQGADVEPGEGETAGSLEAFANSGKGGLANDPDEVDAIKELQQYLNDLGFDTGTVDGQYGRNTINGVKEFQEWMGAAVDGDAGPETIGVIVKLRSIRWGEGGSKDFAEWRRTMTRMEELIGKAGNATESIDVNSIRSILETLRRLDEALSDAEAEELQGIVDELQSAYEDAEFQQILPQRVQQRFSSNMRSAQGVLGDREPADDTAADDTAADDAEAPQTDAEPDADSADSAAVEGEAVYKEVTGSGQGRRYTTFDANGNEVSTGRGAGPQLPTQQEWEAQNSEPEAGAEDPDANDPRAGNTDSGARPGSDEPGAEDPDANDPRAGNTDSGARGAEAGEAVYKEVTGSGQSRQYTTFDADGREVSSGRGAGPNLPTQDEYTAQLAQPTDDGPEAAGSRAALSQVRPDPADVGQTVEPRPTESGVQGDYARAAWDRQYDATHNPDGSPKAGAEEPEAGAEQPGADAEASRRPPEERLNDMLSVDMDGMDLPQLQQFVRDFKADEEIWNMLSPQLKSQLETVLQ